MDHGRHGPDDGTAAAVGGETARLNAVISPLRRALLKAARTAAHLPDLPDAQVEVLRALPDGTVRSPGELATHLGLSRSTVSNLLKAMEGAGLVARSAAVGEGRRVLVRASPHALRLLERFDRASLAVLEDALAGLEDAETDALIGALPALERLRDSIQEASETRAAAAGPT
jgi:DNA-binding MarR family transcriptional regulator